MTGDPGGSLASVTIIDVAKAAGVSKTTASDALRGQGRVSNSTRDTVLEAAQRLGYTLNRSARSLRTATTGTIGLYLPQVLVRSEYYLAVLHGVANEAAALQYDVTLIFGRDNAPASYVPHVDGIVICDARANDPMVDRLLATRLPVVSLEPIPGGKEPTAMIWTDAIGSISALLEELRAGGSLRPGMITTTTAALWPRLAEQAYDDWCDRNAVPSVRTAAHYGADASTLQQIAGTLLDDHPDVDSILCVGDGVAARLSPVITARGYTLGENFLLASGSEQVLEPPVFAAVLTTGVQAGSECARLLFELIRGEAEPGTRREMAVHVRRVDEVAAG